MPQSESTARDQVIEELGRIPTEYLPSFLKLMQAFREGVTLRTAEESFRQGWQEAVCSETLPVSDLWKGIGAG